MAKLSKKWYIFGDKRYNCEKILEKGKINWI